MKISICIPTYNRVELLRQAVQSCLSQTLLPYEILIGDDSTRTETQEWVANSLKDKAVSIRYFHNKPSLKQALNVNSLFQRVSGELVMLLHDDDLLLPNALETLHKCFSENKNIDIAFGKNYLMSSAGVIDEAESATMNKIFYRTADYQGTKLTSLESGFLQQFPNNGYLIKSTILKNISYDDKIVYACDFDFGLKIGIANYIMYFANVYTVCYRLSDESVSKTQNNDAGLYSFNCVRFLDVPASSLPYKRAYLEANAPVAVITAVLLKKYKMASEIYFSPWYRHKILSIRGMRLFANSGFTFIRNIIR